MCGRHSRQSPTVPPSESKLKWLVVSVPRLQLSVHLSICSSSIQKSAHPSNSPAICLFPPICRLNINEILTLMLHTEGGNEWEMSVRLSTYLSPGLSFASYVQPNWPILPTPRSSSHMHAPMSAIIDRYTHRPNRLCLSLSLSLSPSIDQYDSRSINTSLYQPICVCIHVNCYDCYGRLLDSLM